MTANDSRQRPRFVLAQNREKILELHKNGEGLKTIGITFGVKISTIRKFLVASGQYQPFPKGRRYLFLKKQQSSDYIQRIIAKEYQKEIKAILLIDKKRDVASCRHCGNLFPTNLKTWKSFCSQKCRTKSYHNSDFYLEQCDKRAIAEKQRTIEEKMSLYIRQPPTCKICSNPIPFSKFKNNKSSIYCSAKCNGTAVRQKYKSTPELLEKRKLQTKLTYHKRTKNGKEAASKRRYYQNNINARLAKNMRNRLRMALVSVGTRKSAPTATLVGIDIAGLKSYIENQFKLGMSWDNYGDWHIDHIRPCSSFDLTNRAEQLRCFHYTNMQPLWGSENISKSDNWETVEQAA